MTETAPDHDPTVLVLLVALGAGFVLASVASPPDPFSQLLALPVATVIALPGAYWLVFRRGYDGPEVGLLRWVFPVLAPVRLLLALLAVIPVLLLGNGLVAFLPLPGPVALAVEGLIALAAAVAGQWVGFHGGWRVLRASLGPGGSDAEPQ